MSKPQTVTRPPFAEALNAWKGFLQQRGLPADLLWVFGENLIFEPDPAQPGGFRLGYQTIITPPPPDAERIAYEHFLEFEAPIIFYRIGSNRAKSVCLVLCDVWFRGRGEAQGFWTRPEWGIAFRPGEPISVEEIVDEERWKKRLLRARPLHDLDFCMDLRGLHEILAHGRVLSTYEHYALKLLHLWRQIFEPHHKDAPR